MPFADRPIETAPSERGLRNGRLTSSSLAVLAFLWLVLLGINRGQKISLLALPIGLRSCFIDTVSVYVHAAIQRRSHVIENGQRDRAGEELHKNSAAENDWPDGQSEDRNFSISCLRKPQTRSDGGERAA